MVWSKLVNALEIAADFADEFHVLLGGHVGRATKHHVLEHVRKALAIGAFVAAADVIEDADMNDGSVVQGARR